MVRLKKYSISLTRISLSDIYLGATMVSMFFGRVAQLVEQGTENPCVGGSSPPSATLFFLGVLVTGCQTDKCIVLCSRMEEQVRTCIEEWPTEWEHLNASSAAEFQESCQNEWTARSTDMELRERQQAQDQCQETIKSLEAREDPCNLLRTIYFYSP